jgi:hypothetical protein
MFFMVLADSHYGDETQNVPSWWKTGEQAGAGRGGFFL